MATLGAVRVFLVIHHIQLGTVTNNMYKPKMMVTNTQSVTAVSHETVKLII